MKGFKILLGQVAFTLLLWGHAGAQDFIYATNNGSITLYAYTGLGGSVSIPETINGLAVTEIADNMMWGWWPITDSSSVAIPKTITSIGLHAFEDFSGLASIAVDSDNPSYSSVEGVLFDKLQTTLLRFPSLRSGQYQIPTSVTNIGPIAFLDCSGLSSLIMSDQIVTIESATGGVLGIGAFSGSGLTNITIPPLITSLPDYLCANCESLRQVVLPAGLSSIGSATFWFCGNLNDVILPRSLTNIGSFAFVDCTSLKRFKIPANVSNIGLRALTSCSSLAAIDVDPDNVFYSSIDGVLFDKTQTALVQYPGGRAGAYIIPNNITNIPTQAFYSCSNLTGITIPESVVNIEGLAFSGCINLASVSIPKKITALQYGTFDTCINLTNVNIPNSITNIGQKAFDFCTSLTSVTIPASVTEIGTLAFYGCNSLKSVYFQGDAPLLDAPYEVFSDDLNATIYYLAGTTGWGSTFDGRPPVLWNPQALAAGAPFGVNPNNRFGFSIRGTDNIPLVIEASTDLDARSWVPLQSCTLSNGLIYFSDPQWTKYPRRFYRMRSP